MTHQADPIFIALIPLLYVVFAIQLEWYLRYVETSKAKRAIRTLEAVFIGCSIAGYATDLFDIGRFANNAVHLAQVAAILFLVSTMSAKHIAKALDDADS